MSAGKSVELLQTLNQGESESIIGNLFLSQFGFKRRKASGKVDTDTVYSGGRYPIGITFNFKTFPADAHILELWNLEVFTSDRLQVRLFYVSS